jgi:hypothetical protein
MLIDGTEASFLFIVAASQQFKSSRYIKVNFFMPRQIVEQALPLRKGCPLSSYQRIRLIDWLTEKSFSSGPQRVRRRQRQIYYR